jgi:hypothetical protein
MARGGVGGADGFGFVDYRLGFVDYRLGFVDYGFGFVDYGYALDKWHVVERQQSVHRCG